MKLIRLKHDKKTKYHNYRVERELDFSFIRNKKNTAVITFQNVTNIDGDMVEYTVNGTSRFLYSESEDVYFHNLQSDSPLYAHVFWDVLHQLKIGGLVYISEIYSGGEYLGKDYFKECFLEIESESSDVKIFRKTQALRIENDRGLDEWTFGVPVGPENPTFLNKCIERILELDIPKKEIILCGRPHKDFKYFDFVKIVGEDIPAPPVHITKKKNTIVNNAIYNNLCIIHDRVMLPKNFLTAIKRFGDDYPITGLQSFYFVDNKNLIPRRYSDFNNISNNVAKVVDINNFTKKDLSYVGSRKFFYQSAMRSQHGCDYLTGSLYICKRSLWQYCPQNESLYWDEFEDVEHGVRAADVGIPTIVNPFTFTQSINARSIIHFFGYINVITHDGKVSPTRSLTESIPFLKRKPIFRLNKETAKKKLYAFAKKYSANEKTLLNISHEGLSGTSRLRIICQIIESVEMPIWDVEQFVKDFEKEVLCEALPPLHRTDLINSLSTAQRPYDKKMLLVNHAFLQNQISHSLYHSPFMDSERDWFVKRSKFQHVYNKVSAYCMKYLMKGIYLDLNTSEIASVIDGTTMYLTEGTEK